jgi:predicted TIM-barrel fold metal-dependent hydrolase
MAAWPIKFTEGSKSGKKHPLPIDLSTENKKVKGSAYEKEMRPDPSVNLIGHAAITEMIKLQFTTITDRIRNKIRNGNWFLKFSINYRE